MDTRHDLCQPLRPRGSYLPRWASGNIRKNIPKRSTKYLAVTLHDQPIDIVSHCRGWYPTHTAVLLYYRNTRKTTRRKRNIRSTAKTRFPGVPPPTPVVKRRSGAAHPHIPWYLPLASFLLQGCRHLPFYFVPSIALKLFVELIILTQVSIPPENFEVRLPRVRCGLSRKLEFTQTLQELTILRTDIRRKLERPSSLC